MQSITIDYQQLVPRLQAGSGAPDVFSLARQDFQNFLMRFPGEFVDVTDRMERYTSQFAEARSPTPARTASSSPCRGIWAPSASGTARTYSRRQA